MVYTMLVLVLACAIVARFHPDQKSKYWLVSVLISGMLSWISVFVRVETMSYFEHLSVTKLNFLSDVTGMLSAMSMPYLSLILTLIHTGSSPRKVNLLIGTTMATLIAIISVIPIGSTKIRFVTIMLLTICLVSFYAYMFINSVYIERRRVLRKYRIQLFTLIVPVVIIFLVFNIYWAINSVLSVFIIRLASITLTCLILYALWTGVLGAKLRFDQQQVAGTRKSMTTGTSLITHTIKNEMAKVQFLLNQMEVVIDNENHATLKKLTVSIRSSSEHLMRLNQRIKGATTDTRLVRENIALSTLINEVYEQYYLMSQQEERYQISYYAAHDFILNIDVVHMKEVLINLINNAVESSSDSTHRITIDLKLKEENSRAVLSISDTGRGIPKTIQSRIFEPFYTTKKSENNFGLGLSYCRGIIELHGGKMKIISQEGRGTTVFLTFPSKVILARAQLTP